MVSELRSMLDQVREFVEAGDGRNALVILEAITEEYNGWTVLDDSDGEASGFFEDLGPLWTEAVLSADLTPEERRALAKRLTQWQRELEDYGVEEVFDAAWAAAVQGWDYPPLRRVLQGEITDKGAWDGGLLGTQMTWPWPDSTFLSDMDVIRSISTWPRGRPSATSSCLCGWAVSRKQ